MEQISRREYTIGESREEILSKDVSLDIVLPDYLPDIRRILAVHTDCRREGRYISGADAEFATLCCHTVVYLGSDGSVRSVGGESECIFKVPMNGIDGGAASFYFTASAESSTCRPVSPRKLTVKAAVRGSVLIWWQGEPCSTPSGDSGLQILPGSILSEQVCSCMGEELPLSVVRRTGRAGELNVLFSRAAATHDITEISDGKAAVSGEVRFTAFCAAETGSPFEVTASVPYTYTMESDDISSSGYLMVCPMLSDITATAEQDDSGSFSVAFGTSLHIDGVSVTNGQVPLTHDVFSLSGMCDVRYRNIEAHSCRGMESSLVKLTAELPRSEGSTDEYAVASCFATLHRPTFDVQDDTLCYTVPATLHIITLSPGGEGDEGDAVSCHTAECSFFGQTPLPAASGICTRMFFELIGAECRPSADGFTASVELQTDLYCRSADSARVIDGFTVVPDAEPLGVTGELIAVYLTEEDTLWQVAKRFRVPCSEIAATCGMPCPEPGNEDDISSTDGMIRLIIEK